MLDIQFIRDNTAIVKEASKNKNVDVDIDRLLELDEQRRDLQTKVDNLRQQRNEVAAAAKGSRPTGEQISKGREVKDKLTAIETRLSGVNEKYQELMLAVPNPPSATTPLGKDEADNMVLKTWGKPTEFSFTPKDHVELGHLLDLLDLETAAQTSGSRFYYLKNDAVLLELALTQWVMGKLVNKGFTPVITPQLVRENMMKATGFFPAEKNEIYQVNTGEDDLYLIGTSEVPLAGLHMSKTLNKDELPRRYVGSSTCFRREAGSYGQDTRGIFRVHQFNKLEMFSYVHPDNSWEEHDYLLEIEEEILQALELPYQVVNISSGDLGPSAAKKYDCEVWIPTHNTYRELTSCSNTTDFQARRGGIKFKDEKGSHFAHTLNGTAMASTRTLIAILENYQTEDGKVRVPEVLRPYLGKEMIG